MVAMSPLIDLQRRLVEVGRIRMGEKNPQGYPTRLQTWKLTSRDRVRLQEAAKVYGGEVQEWEGHEGQWKLYTQTDALPILLLPGQTLSQSYEIWSGGGCQRRCDGEQEQISDGPCLCDPENRECKPHSRLSVMLPDVPGLGCWRLDTQGYYAAIELAGAVDLLEMATARGVLLPARLRIDQRTSLRAGQTRHYPVPTLDLDIRPLEMIQIARGGAVEQGGTHPALPAASEENGVPPMTYTPLPSSPGEGATLADGLAAVTASQTEPTPRSGRAAAPIGAGADFLSDEPVPVPDDQAAPHTPGAAIEALEERETPLIASEAQQRLIRVRASQAGLTDDERHDVTEHICGQPSSKDVPADKVDELLLWLDIEGAVKRLLARGEQLGYAQETRDAIANTRAAMDESNHAHRTGFLAWLETKIASADEKLKEREAVS